MIHGLENGRYQFRQEQLMSVIAVIAGSVLSSIFLVLEGYKTWRDSGSDVAELLLISLGMDAKEMYQIARSDLPALKEL